MTACTVTQCTGPSDCRPALPVVLRQSVCWGINWVGLEATGKGNQDAVLVDDTKPFCP